MSDLTKKKEFYAVFYSKVLYLTNLTVSLKMLEKKLSYPIQNKNIYYKHVTFFFLGRGGIRHEFCNILFRYIIFIKYYDEKKI